MRLVTVSLIGLLIASPLLAQEPAVEDREHVVRVGDTLWDIAGRYFSDPHQWRAIYEANASVVANPHWIYPSEVLVIPGAVAGAGDGALGTAGERVAGSGQGTTTTGRTAEPPARTLFYRPPPVRPREGEATVLSEPGSMVLPVKLGEFMAAPYLRDPDGLDIRGVFVRAIRDDVAGPGGATSAHPQDRVYLGYGPGPRPAIGDRLAVVSVGRPLDDARGSDHIIEPRGIVRIVDMGSDVMEGQVESQFGPIYPDHLLVPVAMFPDFQVEEAEPVENGYDLEARIIAFADEQPMYGPTELAFVDVGRLAGIMEGDIFHAYLPQREARDEDTGELRSQVDVLPPEAVAELRVVRVGEDHATVKVDHVFLPRLAPGLPVMRVRRIP